MAKPFSFATPPPTGAPVSEAEKEAAKESTFATVREQARGNFEKRGARLKYLWTLRGTAVVGSLIAGGLSYFMVYPFIRTGVREMFSYDRPLASAQDVLPGMSVAWWINQWRKGVNEWRRGEDDGDFYRPLLEWVVAHTGKDLSAPFAAFGYDPAQASDSIKRGEAWNTDELKFLKGVREQIQARKEWEAEQEAEMKRFEDIRVARADMRDPWMNLPGPTVEKEVRQVSKFEGDTTRPRVLVTLSGDTPMIRHFAQWGYNVDAVDCCDVAFKAFIERTEALWLGINEEPMHRMHLHCMDIFEPTLWRMLPRKGFDVIWDRQGISAIDPDARDDYAFVLKRALKDTGVLYIEGTFRSKRFPRNRVGGPPFHFGEKNVQGLFPLSEGYMVKCDKLKELSRDDLTPEQRLTGELPKALKVRHFPCVVWKDEARAAALLAEMRAQPDLS